MKTIFIRWKLFRSPLPPPPHHKQMAIFNFKALHAIVFALSFVIVFVLLLHQTYPFDSSQHDLFATETTTAITITTTVPESLPSAQNISMIVPKNDNLTFAYLKQAIKSIKQQKRNIISKHQVQLNYHRNLIEKLSPNRTRLHKLTTSTTTSKVASAKRENVTLSTKNVFSSATSIGAEIEPLIEDGIFWSQQIESRIPRGFSPEDDREWLRSLQRSRVIDAESGCGRMQNRLIEFAGGSKACARYRRNHEQVQGEFVSFLLARMLRIGNVPPSAFVRFDPEYHQTKEQDENAALDWTDMVREKLRSQAQWDAKPVILTKFVDKLTPAYIPECLRSATGRHFHPTNPFDRRATDEIVQLVQWSDLIVFDYLTANLDRMLNNMINERWNAQMMHSPAHNLLRDRSTNLLLFLDNESGLFHGYRLLKKYEPLHRSLLDATCIFRRSTIDRLRSVNAMSDKQFATVLSHNYRHHMLGYGGGGSANQVYSIANILPRNNLLTLRRRIAQVLDQVKKCEARFQRV